MKRAFDGLISRMDVVEKRYSEVEEIVIEASKTKEQRIKFEKNKTQNLSAVGQL